MYNFKNVIMDANDMWDSGKEQLCAELHKGLDQLPTLMTRSGKSGPTGGSVSATYVHPGNEFKSVGS